VAILPIVDVAAIQYRPPKGRPSEARTALARMVAEASADVVVCPEMATTGYVWRDAATLRGHAEPAAGPTFAALSPIARRNRSWVIVGFPEIDGDSLYNSALVIGPDGSLVCTYRKVLLYEADLPWARAGNTRMLCESAFGLLAPAICMDLNDPGFPRFLEAQSPAVVCFATNWVEEDGFEVLPYWRERLGSWKGVFVAADTWGVDEGVRFHGRSVILSAGQVLAEAPAEGDAVIRASVHPMK
jgi:predicted amidohydrolase